MCCGCSRRAEAAAAVWPAAEIVVVVVEACCGVMSAVSKVLRRMQVQRSFLPEAQKVEGTRATPGPVTAIPADDDDDRVIHSIGLFDQLSSERSPTAHRTPLHKSHSTTKSL